MSDNNVVEGSGNLFRLLVRATPAQDSKGVAGTGLWQLDSYVTPDPTSDIKLAPQTQILLKPQQDLILRQRSILDFGSVDYKHDLTSVQCNEMGYLCVELSKGPSPSATFDLLTVPEGSILKACNHLECKGVRANSIDWSYEATNVVPGEQTPFCIQASVSMADGTRELSGDGLWRLGLFGSRSPDGIGERHDFIHQTLNDDKASQMIESGKNLDLADINTQFDAGALGCTDFKYVCVEFAKGDNAEPDFSFTVANKRSEYAEEKIVSCKPAPCEASKFYFIYFIQKKRQISYMYPLIIGML